MWSARGQSFWAGWIPHQFLWEVFAYAPLPLGRYVRWRCSGAAAVCSLSAVCLFFIVYVFFSHFTMFLLTVWVCTRVQRSTMALFAQRLLLALIIWELLMTCQTLPHLEGEPPLIYSRDMLLSLCYTGITLLPADLSILPEVFIISLSHRRLRRRDWHGGIWQHLRWRGSRPPLPGMILSNTRSLSVCAPQW